MLKLNTLSKQAGLPLQLRLADSPDRMIEVGELTADLAAAREEIEELKHNLTQAKINNDISQHEVKWIRQIDQSSFLLHFQLKTCC